MSAPTPLRRLSAVVALSSAWLLLASGAASAQDNLPPGDVRIFSAFHSRLLESSELGTWAAGRLTDRKARDVATWLAGYSGTSARSLAEFVSERGGAVERVDDDSLVVAARRLREELGGLSGPVLDSTWLHRVNLWMDAARVRAIFVDSKQLEHKAARGRESSLRWAWGEPYFATCVVRKRFERSGRRGKDEVCGWPPRDPSAEQS